MAVSPAMGESPRGGPLYKILPRSAWAAANDRVPWAPIDEKDGFVHLSAAHQVRETASKHFGGTTGLCLLEVDPGRISDEAMRWEVSRGGDLFPHVHGDIARSAVVGEDDLPWTDDGFVFPPHMPETIGEPMPDPLARRLETAEAGTLLALARAAERAIPDHAPAHRVFGKAVAARFGDQSPINAFKGWGLDAPELAHLEAAEAMYAETGSSFAVEICSHAALETLEILGQRAYRAVAVENILVRPLDETIPAHDSVTLEPMPPSDADAWGEMLGRGFTDGAEPPPEIAIYGRITQAVGMTRNWFIVAEGERVGVCSMRFDHEIALLMGSAVLVEHRGRGYHTAALMQRLARAAQLGCRYAKVDVQPGSASHRNAHRAGFRLSHTRTAFARSDA